MTVHWVVWDAAARWIVDRLDAEGALPAVRALRHRGARGAGRPPTPCCQTAPSLATLFTGTSTAEHGVSGFTVPDQRTVAGHRSGFAPEFPARPPVWRDPAAAGLRTAFVHTPWVFDADGGVGDGVRVAVEAYSGRLATHDVLALTGEAVVGWPVDRFPVEVDTTGGRVRLRAGGGEHDLGGSAGDGTGWTAVRLAEGVGFWVRRHRTTAGPVLVRTGTWRVRVAGSDRALVDRVAGAPVFAGEGVGTLYRAGLFGPRLVDGGDGTAERALAESLELVAAGFAGATRAVLDGLRSDDRALDLVQIYLPWTDEIGHELIGWCDPRSAAHRPDVADRVWETVRRGYRAADDVLAAVLDRAGPDDTVLLCADHGVAGFTHLVHVNDLLADAGLAVPDGAGGVDPARSRVVYHPANNGSLRVNHAGLDGGVVPAGEVAATLRAATAALRALPAVDGRPAPVRGFLDPLGNPLPADGVGSDPGAPVFPVFDSDHQPTAGADGGPAVRPSAKCGSHVVNTGDDRLHAVFAAAGPGLPAGVELGPVANTLAARLVRHLLTGGGLPTELAPDYLPPTPAAPPAPVPIPEGAL